MMSELAFYTNPMSRGRIVRWMLEEIGAPYETVLLDYGTTMKAPDYLAINPMGKVPAIVHKGRVVTEGAAIIAYLAEAFPEAGLAPVADERADYYRWMFFAAGPVEAATTDRSFGVQPDARQQTMAGYGTLDRVVDVLEQAVSAHPYIAGERFTAADVYVGSHVGWGMQFGSLPKREAFERYVERIMSRPAAARAREIDDALIPQQEPAG
ncbi:MULTISPECIES: glutathione S-transferase family protein [unclassified Sphingomonas]|uniref:glutathione S-transferase family protein n=1 Tax=unclassified Sphingomonas TaxID=196159 RepID=UPI000925D62B|nr:MULTISPECIES: glutathione S-transferase family protein [unclassified Sphingomonas]MBN8849097.1 glutathione S-transferase family protein [Sphingomonas sp.]OJV29434.1 MAG: glutathione S-transferase [Sphingomonas sp. 67-36]